VKWALVVSGVSVLSGCSVCTYDFIRDGSVQTGPRLKADMDACYSSATQGVDLVDVERHREAARGWMACMHGRGYTVAKR